MKHTPSIARNTYCSWDSWD